MREKPSFYVALTPIIFMMIVLVIGIGVMGWPASVCLLISAAFSCIIAMAKLKYTWDEIQGFIIDKISAVMAPVLIVIFVGFMVATWSYAGTLPMLVYYGMLLVAPAWLYAIAFFLNAVLSYVSGAYFGDKLSPLSDTTNLTSAVTKTKLYDLIKYLLWTTIPSTIISLLFFTWLGMIHTSTGSISPESMQMLVQLKELYKFGLLPLLPMLIVLCFTFLRLPTVPALLSSAFVAVLVGWLYQGFPLDEGIKATMSGFRLTMITDSTTLLPSVKELLEQGGLNNQGGFLSFIICAMMFAGILTGTGMMDVTLQSAANKIKSAFGAILASGVLAIIINLLTGSDGLNKIVISELMMKKFEDLNLSPLVLARTLEDFGTMSAPIIPWSAAGLYMATTLGVPTFSYLPYCVFCFCSMIFALIYASTGFRLLRFNEAKA
ncbi:Na+/H+ antiporter NhaC family protein [Escherichia coli]|uniref:Na+/H+ antiporter NhaC family protein n=1 Tax=Escherichia coli TaxID=562 RepID=UPI0023629946|nr:Na+/H+ antiporter NhaC family protein [Escherichia coli]